MLLPAATKHDDARREAIRQALAFRRRLREIDASVGPGAPAERRLTLLHLASVREFLADHRAARTDTMKEAT